MKNMENGGRKMKPIVSFDMDMTLLDHETFQVPESARDALEKLRENYMIVLATGRDMDSHYSANLKGRFPCPIQATS